MKRISLLALFLVVGCQQGYQNQSTGGTNFEPGCKASSQHYTGCCPTHGGPKVCNGAGYFEFNVDRMLICSDDNLATDCIYTP